MGNVRFTSTVNGASALAIAAGIGNVNFDGVVGGVTPLTALTISSAAVATFANNVATTGNQSITATSIVTRNTASTTGGDITFAGAVTLTSNARWATAGGTLTVASVNGTVNSLEIATAGGTATVTGDTVNMNFVTLHDDVAGSTGTVNFLGDVQFTRLVTVGRGYAVNMTGSSIYVNEPATFLNTGVLTLGDASTDVITFNQGIRTAGSATNPSQVRLAGTLSTTNAYAILGPTVLTANSAVDTAGTGGPITFASTLNGAFDLRLDAGNSTIDFDGIVGGTTPVNAVTIDRHGRPDGRRGLPRRQPHANRRHRQHALQRCGHHHRGRRRECHRHECHVRRRR